MLCSLEENMIKKTPKDPTPQKKQKTKTNTLLQNTCKWIGFFTNKRISPRNSHISVNFFIGNHLEGIYHPLLSSQCWNVTKGRFNMSNQRESIPASEGALTKEFSSVGISFWMRCGRREMNPFRRGSRCCKAGRIFRTYLIYFYTT